MIRGDEALHADLEAGVQQAPVPASSHYPFDSDPVADQVSVASGAQQPVLVV